MFSSVSTEYITPAARGDLSPESAAMNSEAFIADLAADVEQWRSRIANASMQIATFDAREVGALRQACYAAGVEPFGHLHEAEEGMHLKRALGATLSVPSISSVDIVRRITVLRPDFVFPGKARENDTREPDERFADDLVQARAVVYQAMDWVSGLSDEAILDVAASVFAYPAAPHNHAPTLRQSLDVLLSSTASDLHTNVGRARATMDALSLLSTASFSPKDGWVMTTEPPIGFSAAQRVAEAYAPLADCYVPSARARAEAAATSRLAQLGIVPTNETFLLPTDPRDHFDIRAEAQRLGWNPTSKPARYGDGQREYLSYKPVTLEAAQFLHDHYVRANYRVSVFDIR